jgi:hypothetical protein
VKSLFILPFIVSHRLCLGPSQTGPSSSPGVVIKYGPPIGVKRKRTGKGSYAPSVVPQHPTSSDPEDGSQPEPVGKPVKKKRRLANGTVSAPKGELNAIILLQAFSELIVGSSDPRPKEQTEKEVGPASTVTSDPTLLDHLSPQPSLEPPDPRKILHRVPQVSPSAFHPYLPQPPQPPSPIESFDSPIRPRKAVQNTRKSSERMSRAIELLRDVHSY